MATRTQSRPDPLNTEPVADLTPRRRRRAFRERRNEWREADQRAIERLFPHPTDAEYHHPSYLSRAKTDASYNPLWKLRRLFKELALADDWHGYELLIAHVLQTAAEVRSPVPDGDELCELLRLAHHELADVQAVSVDALADGVVDDVERVRIAKETDDGLAALKRLRRRLDGSVT